MKLPMTGLVCRVEQEIVGRMIMYNCSSELGAFQKQKARLSTYKIDVLLEDRRCIKKLLRDNLRKKGKLVPYKRALQGSFVMRTMVQDKDDDYDLDDGAYFDVDDPRANGWEKHTPQQAREVVWNALNHQANSFKPELKNKCVRLHFKGKTHIDIPVFRKRTLKSGDFIIEHAANNDWNPSNVQEVETWYEDFRKSHSNKKQVLRITRLLKKFAKVHTINDNHMLSGFGITILLSEVGKFCDNREDVALYKAMELIYNRLTHSTTIRSPIKPRLALTKRNDDHGAHAFKNILNWALDALEPLFADDCKRDEALDCWDRVFKTNFFNDKFGITG